MKKAVLVVSFGTTYVETRKKTIEACEEKIREVYPDYEVFRAFTSNMVIKRIKEQEGITIPTTDQALAQIKEKGYRDVIIQPLHIILGSEYHKIVKDVMRHRPSFDSLVIGRPLLNVYEDYLKVVAFLEKELVVAKGEAILLMAHGSEHPSFAAYACLAHLLKHPFYLACVESYPFLDGVIEELKIAGITKVHLYPFMLVAGDHARNDMASDREESWKSQLIRQGFQVATHLVGLGGSVGIQGIYLSHLADAMKVEE